MPLRSVRRVSKLPRAPRKYTVTRDVPIVRDRRPLAAEFGDDPLEQRAISKGMFPGATLPERILYKKLVQMIGQRGFIFQRSELGGRNYLGGFVIDFVIVNPYPGIAIEVLGDHWHRSEQQYADRDRALMLLALGYQYEEIWEHDIYHSDEYLEQILRGILSGSGVPQTGAAGSSGKDVYT